ncbi:hypothetical protein [Chryseobacterium salviniae]|uniref:SH3 domain-containing protein n=1 Tax=Chryseobacterium salviniae TaxID=3101750 RepID=A0ABU6HQ26_9FLAO|nr:hypothetical protein [Chryseobacterium sp. T9W2-O]MEC3874195.1 hypothetical protein [Chryseobacterium sp. T9W2-O]
MKILLGFLIKNGYKLLQESDFKNKLKEYFGILEFSKDEDVLFFNHPKGYDIDVKGQFINTYEVELHFLQEMEILEQGIRNEDNNHFICYNKIVFNDDSPSITQILQNKKAIEDLVIYFDYEKSPILLNFALNYLDTDNNEVIYIEHLLFYNDKTRQEPIKKHLLLKIIEKNEDFFITIICVLVEFWDGFSTKNIYKYRALAFMFEELLKKYDVEKDNNEGNKAYLILNNSYVEKEDVIENFVKNNFYGYALLEKYSNIYKSLDEITIDHNSTLGTKITSLILHDRPDFSSFSREILAKGEIETVHSTKGWDFVKIDGVTGYLATEEAIKEKEKMAQKKFSFLAEEESEEKNKKKGFWDNLFG